MFPNVQAFLYTRTIPVRCYGFKKYMFKMNVILFYYLRSYNLVHISMIFAKSISDAKRKKVTQSENDGPQPPIKSFIGVKKV